MLRKRQKEEDDSDEEFFCIKVKKRKSMKDTKSDCNNKVRDVNCDEKNNFDGGELCTGIGLLSGGSLTSAGNMLGFIQVLHSGLM